uniref:Saposin B-type domain-containing protein n=1 Tax=Parastrongyloides trichosuri TaxID=131310 RepID=A0A0N4ZIX7_PARTI
MKFITFITLFALVVISSAAVVRSNDGANCGIRYSKKIMDQLMGRVRGASLICELCLDLVLVGEQFAECGEEYVADKLEKECDKYLGTNLLDTLCHSLVDDLAAEIVNDTEKDPSKICTKITKKPCSYA